MAPPATSRRTVGEVIAGTPGVDPLLADIVALIADRPRDQMEAFVVGFLTRSSRRFDGGDVLAIGPDVLGRRRPG
jgi:hypothetical protein